MFIVCFNTLETFCGVTYQSSELSENVMKTVALTLKGATISK